MPMKILIAVDMEGITGVTTWNHVTPGSDEWKRMRHVMTADVNAAIKGAIQGGVDEVVIADGHWNGTNLLLEELDGRARLNISNSAPLSMVRGVDTGVKAAMFVGYHARAGSWKATLDHTWNQAVANVWLNGRLIGETGLNGAVCGHFNVPVIMISGDQAVAAEASDLLPGIECAVVKNATSRFSAECLPPEITQQRIREAATRAISRFHSEDTPPPLRLEPPILLAVEFTHTDMADRAEIVPDALRLDARRIQFTCSDMLAAYRSFRAAANLAGG